MMEKSIAGEKGGFGTGVPKGVAAPEAGNNAAAGGALVPTFAACTNIVALAGAEQINPALETGVDVVLAGRTTDTAIIAALPIARGSHAGAAWHGAKIGESGALCAANPQSGVILVDFDDTGFTITPLADGAHATPHPTLPKCWIRICCTIR